MVAGCRRSASLLLLINTYIFLRHMTYSRKDQSEGRVRISEPDPSEYYTLIRSRSGLMRCRSRLREACITRIGLRETSRGLIAALKETDCI
jgi:hypothetical protein